MSDTGSKVTPIGAGRRLSDAIREVKSVIADRDDVVVEMRQAERMRLELLAHELEPVFADIPQNDDYFDLAISSGTPPRLWIDATAHVAMGRDKRVYRFVRDTRMGRIVLAESTDPKPIADRVTRYIAERMVERERLMVDGIQSPIADTFGYRSELERKAVRYLEETGWSAVWTVGMLAASGAVLGVAFALALLWERVPALTY